MRCLFITFRDYNVCYSCQQWLHFDLGCFEWCGRRVARWLINCHIDKTPIAFGPPLAITISISTLPRPPSHTAIHLANLPALSPLSQNERKASRLHPARHRFLETSRLSQQRHVSAYIPLLRLGFRYSFQRKVHRSYLIRRLSRHSIGITAALIPYTYR